MLRAEGIHKTYKDGKKDLRVLQDVNLKVLKGEAVAVVGPSGAGKSTLLHILGGIDNPTKGKVFLADSDLYTLPECERARVRNRNIGFVFQFYHLLHEFSALENAMMPALIKYRASGLRRKDTHGKAEALLRELGLGERLGHRPNKLSGGEQQRVAIARALVNSPELLLCDEPTGNLDSEMGEGILEILFGLSRKNKSAVVIVTHDRGIAKKADRFVEIRDGRIK